MILKIFIYMRFHVIICHFNNNTILLNILISDSTEEATCKHVDIYASDDLASLTAVK